MNVCVVCGNSKSNRNKTYCSQKCFHKSRRGKTFSLQHRERIRKALLGRKRPEEVKRKVSETRKRRIRLGLIVPWNKGKKGSQVGWLKGVDKSDPRLQKILRHKTWRVAQKKIQKLMKDSEWKAWWLKRSISGQNVKPNNLETTLLQLIEAHSFPLKYVGDGQVIIGGKCPDFIHSNGENKVVEIFGDYWHRKRGIAWHQTEYGTKKVYAQYGFECLILWEHEIKESNEDELSGKLEAFLNAS